MLRMQQSIIEPRRFDSSAVEKLCTVDNAGFGPYVGDVNHFVATMLSKSASCRVSIGTIRTGAAVYVMEDMSIYLGRAKCDMLGLLYYDELFVGRC